MFFSFDGIDGVGKSTQVARFVEWLGDLGHDVVTCRDPGSTVLGDEIRHQLLEHRDTPISRASEMFLYMAARAQLVHEVIRPALDQGRTVVSDRFLLSNVVYQGHAGGLDVPRLWNVGELATDGLRPDCIFLLDMDVVSAARRRNRAPDRMESQGDDYLAQVRRGFLSEAARDTQRIHVIDASGSADEVQQSIRAVASEPLKLETS